MIITKLTGKAVPAFDVEIARFLASGTFDADGSAMVIAIENDAGEIYRRIDVMGGFDFISMVTFLQDLELEDLLEDAEGMVAGLDCRFRLPVSP